MPLDLATAALRWPLTIAKHMVGQGAHREPGQESRVLSQALLLLRSRYGQSGYGQGAASGGGYGAQQDAYSAAASTGHDAAGYGASAAASAGAGYGSQVQ